MKNNFKSHFNEAFFISVINHYNNIMYTIGVTNVILNQ